MDYKHACFISYKHPPASSAETHLWYKSARVFEERLKDFLTTKVTPFRDNQLRVGNPYPDVLARSLCESMCLIALIVPEYVESNWCRAEWKAMEALEEKRLGPGRRELIFPVIIKGDREAFTSFIDPRHGRFMQNILDPGYDLRRRRNLKIISEIADEINALERKLRPQDSECDQFMIDVKEEESIPTVNEPSPFRHV